MNNEIGWIVRSVAGRDGDALFYVIGLEAEFLLLADGKRRRVSVPKRKKRRHVEPLQDAAEQDATAQKLKRNEPVSDRELRRALAAFKGGNHAWQKTI